MTLLQSLSRILAFVGKEFTETLRRPGAVLSLVLGPLLIMVLFGISFYGYPPPFRTVIVVPPNSGLPTTTDAYSKLSPDVDVVGVVNDAAAAREQLRLRTIDLVIIAPPDLAAQFLAGKQSVLDAEVNISDPIAAANAGYIANILSGEVNERVVEEAVRQGMQTVVAKTGQQPTDVPPNVIAAPTRTHLTNVAAVQPAVVSYFGPAMLAFVLQHLAVSLVALSVIRERGSGSFELFRVLPVSAAEVVMGKVIAFAVICAIVGAITTVGLVAGLGVPMLGDPVLLAVALGLVIAASLGIGVIIAVVSDSERQAVQLSLLVLLAAVFFSGFALNLDLFQPLARPFTYILPATHGIALAHDLMLYGWTNAPWHFAALFGMAVGLIAIGSLMLSRQIARS
ncbi:MAG TPA: ABC transporter permease [Methylomirabilota bacterium]|nr:ABC transporter permease [Methylomirabilota bacterium]